MAELKNIATALNAFQAEVVAVHKSADNPFFKSKYAPLEAIMRSAFPILTRHGLAVTQLLDNLDGQSALTTTLLHTSGESISSTMPLLLTKQDAQGQGSAITYARRYSYAAVLGIVIDEDDDGNRASQPAPTLKTLEASANARKTPANPEAPATEKQRTEIAKELMKLEIPKEDMEGYLIERFGVDLPLTVEKASFVIGELYDAKGVAPAQKVAV